MARYRFYLLDDNGHIFNVETADCEDDSAAQKWADELYRKHCRVIEVWDRGRAVGKRGPDAR